MFLDRMYYNVYGVQKPITEKSQNNISYRNRSIVMCTHSAGMDYACSSTCIPVRRLGSSEINGIEVCKKRTQEAHTYNVSCIE